MQALRVGDLRPGRERRQILKSQVHPHRALRDWQQRRLDLSAETHVVAAAGVARERYQVRPFDFGEVLGQLKRTELGQTHQATRPAPPHALKAHAPSSSLALESRVTATPGKEVPKRRILIAQALDETGRRDQREPLVSRSMFPLREPARDIVARECQSARLISLATDGERCIPQPASGSEPAIKQPTLSVIWIDANSVASGDGSDLHSMSWSANGLQAHFGHDCIKMRCECSAGFDICRRTISRAA